MNPMVTRSKLHFAVFLVICGVTASQTLKADFLPKEVEPQLFQGVKSSSPFTRSLNLPNTMILTGVAELEGARVAVLVDSTTGASMLISEKESVGGWRLLDVKDGNNLDKAVATIARGDGDSFRVAYDKKLHEEVAKKYKTRVTATKGIKSDVRQGDEKKEYYAKMKQKFAALSKEQQAEVRKIMAEKSKAKPNMTPRDKGTLYLKVLDYVGKKGQ